MWQSELAYKETKVLFYISFILLFIVGSLSRIVLANRGIDIVLHNTYYVVTHFHYILSLEAMQAIFAEYYY